MKVRLRGERKSVDHRARLQVHLYTGQPATSANAVAMTWTSSVVSQAALRQNGKLALHWLG